MEGSETHTDTFIADIIAVAPRTEQPTGENSSLWADTSRPPKREQSQGFTKKLLRQFFFACNIVFILIGMAILVAAIAFASSTRELLQLSPPVRTITTMLFSMSGIVLIIGCLGLLSTRFKLRSLLALYVVLLVILILCLAVFTVVFFVVANGHTDTFRKEVGEQWNELLHDSDPPVALCHLQDALECSGFETPCTDCCGTRSPSDVFICDDPSCLDDHVMQASTVNHNNTCSECPCGCLDYPDANTFPVACLDKVQTAMHAKITHVGVTLLLCFLFVLMVAILAGCMCSRKATTTYDTDDTAYHAM